MCVSVCGGHGVLVSGGVLGDIDCVGGCWSVLVCVGGCWYVKIAIEN